MRLIALIFALIGWLAITPSARAQASASGGGYQHRLIRDAERELSLEPEIAPEGKLIEKIVVVNQDVITEEDPLPGFLNWFHITTKAGVVRRELLFSEGDRWSQELVNESARNLRSYLFTSVAQIVPCKASTPNGVVALVVTKDLWSLRLSTDFSYVGSTLESLDLELAERNTAGRMKKTAIDFGLDLATFSGGEQYVDPRLFGQKLSLTEQGTLITNRSTGELEGGEASLSIGRPLYSLETRWGWNASLDFRRDIYRLFSNAKPVDFVDPSTRESIPFSYRRQNLTSELSVTRSFGRERKLNTSLGWRGLTRQNELLAPLGTSAQTLSDFRQSFLPFDQRAGLLFAQADFYFADYIQWIDINTFALTEDFRLGPQLVAEVRWANPAFGFSSHYLEPVVSFDETWRQGDDLLSAGASAQARYEPERDNAVTGFAGHDWMSESVSLRFRNISPQLSFFRVHSALRLTRRVRDLDRTIEVLGGNNQLRGYPSSYLSGSQLWVANLELRTVPYSWHTVHLGGATFLDMGGAGESVEQLSPHAAAGLGARILFPQINYQVIRFDLGFPLEKLAAGESPAYVSLSFDQAF